MNVNQTLEDLGITGSPTLDDDVNPNGQKPSGKSNVKGSSSKNSSFTQKPNSQHSKDYYSAEEYELIMSYKRHLETLVATGKCKEYIGKNFTFDDLDKMSLEEIEKWYTLYVVAQGKKLTEHLSHSFIKLYTKSCSYFLNIDDEDKLQKDLMDDYMLRNELSRWGGYLALRLGPAMSLISTSLITFSHVKRDASSKPTEKGNGFASLNQNVLLDSDPDQI